MLQSKETVYKHRIQEDQSYGTICFDHQATRKLTGKYEGTSHRLAIVWYSEKNHKVLGMPEMTNKAAESQAKAVRETCDEFGIQNQQISGVTCDNAITNIGVHGGTCTLMEYALNKTLLRLMCRHHILEIVIKDVYHHLFTSDTPNNLFYSALKESWSELREANFPFEPFDDDSIIEEMGFDAYQLFTGMKNAAVTELQSQLKIKHVRDDYREVALVALKFFGISQTISKGNQVKFRTIINPSNARFMATIIQGIECYLFRNNFEWDSQDVLQMKHNLMRFSMFASLIYIRYWNRCSTLFDAPKNDLNFLQELQSYQNIDEDVSRVAMFALNRHLYYMSEELAPLSLFSEKVSTEEK